MFTQDDIAQELFELALKREGTTVQALAALARIGRIAEIYLGPFAGQRLLDSSKGLDSSMMALTSIPSE